MKGRALTIFTVVVIAVLACVAAIAKALDWQGWWVAGVAVALAVLTLAWKLWTDVLKPEREREAAEAVEQGFATAVTVQLSRDGDGVQVSVSNHGTHEVRKVTILGIPVEGFADPMFAGPQFRPFGDRAGILFVPTPGGDLSFSIDSLDPNTGSILGTYQAASADAGSRIQFDLTWIDHQGRQRMAYGVGSLAPPPVYADVEMRPR